MKYEERALLPLLPPLKNMEAVATSSIAPCLILSRVTGGFGQKRSGPDEAVMLFSQRRKVSLLPSSLDPPSQGQGECLQEDGCCKGQSVALTNLALLTGNIF